MIGASSRAAPARAFVLWEWRTKSPLLPLRLFRDRSFTVANVVGLGFSFGAFGSMFILIQFLQVVQGSSPLEAACRRRHGPSRPWSSPRWPDSSPRASARGRYRYGPRVARRALFWLTALLDADPPTRLRRAVPPAGIGMGLVFAPSATAVLAGMAPDDQAKASGTNSMLREVGVALGIAFRPRCSPAPGGELTPAILAAPSRRCSWGRRADRVALVALLLPSGRGTAHRAPASAPDAASDLELVAAR